MDDPTDWDNADRNHGIDVEEPLSYTEVLHNLQSPVAGTDRKHWDSKSIRLAAVTCAVLDIVKSTASSPNEDPTAAQVYAKAVTALEGSLKRSDHENIVDSFATMSSLLELLHVTIPYVSPPAILSHTLQPLTSRVLRAVVGTASAVSSADEDVVMARGNAGGANAVLRASCKVATVLLQALPHSTDEKAVHQYIVGTIMVMFRDGRPKVRKAAQNAAIEVLVDPRKLPHTSVTKALNTYIHNEFHEALSKEDSSMHDFLHVFPFLERSVFRLDFNKIGDEVMTFLSALLQQQAASNDFMTVKVKETTPKVLAITSLLSLVLVMLLDDEHDEYSKVFSQRVLASLLQFKSHFILSISTVEFEISEKSITAYGQVVIAASSRVLEHDAQVASKLLPLAVQTVVQLSKPSDSNPNSTAGAQLLLMELTQLFRTKIPLLMQQYDGRNVDQASVRKCLSDTLHCVVSPIVSDTSYRPTWTTALPMIAVLIERVHSTVDVEPSVESLIQLRSSAPKSLVHAIDDAVASLVQGVGIEICWNWIHWHDGSSKSKGIVSDKAWLLSVMKSAAMAAQVIRPRLAFFQNDILGLARISDQLATNSPSASEMKSQRSRTLDLWNLFPCFCKSPSDVETGLPPLTSTLGRALEDKRYPELMTVICHGLSTLVKSVEEDGGFELDCLSGDTSVLGATSSSLLPILFKFVSDTHAAVSSSKADTMDVEERSTKESTSPMDSFQKLQSVTDAISSLARFAPEGFVKGLFKKVMQRLLEEVQSESGDTEKICSLLTLSQALVASKVLDDPSMSFLFRALKPLIKNDEHGPRVQKRAYKVLSELCERHHAFVAESERLHELSLLLTGTIMTSQISARYMRLKCLNIIVDGLDESNQEQLKEMYKVIPEVLLCLKDSNGKTREAAYQLLLSLASTGDIVEFVKVTVAALGSETSHMRSAVVMALSRLVFEQGWENDTFHSLLPGLLKTVLVLIHEGSREVIKSVIGFIRICVAAIPSEQLEPLVPELVGSMLKSQYAKSRFRAKIKIILKKLVKRYGYDALMPHVPESETRLLTHIRKLDEREKRRKLVQRESEKMQAENYDAMVDSDEEDSDDGRTFMTGATGLTRKSSRAKTLDGKSTAASKRSLVSGAGASVSSKSKTGLTSNFRLPNEADGEVVDMLNSKAVQRVQFDDGADSDSDDDSSMEMNFDDEGKLVVRENDEGSKTTEADELLPMAVSAKRRRLSGSVTGQDLKKQTRKGGGHPKGGIGASYKAKKAGGDVKKKGQKYEPFAFVPLDGRAYTKKNRRLAVEQMSTVVRQGGKRKRQASRGPK